MYTHRLYQRLDYFYSRHPVPTTPDVDTPGTGSSPAAVAAAVAHFSDDRGRIQSEDPLTDRLRFLSPHFPRTLLSTVRVSGVRFPRASVRATIAVATVFRSSADPSIARNIGPSLSFSYLVGPGLACSSYGVLFHRHAFRSIRKTRPVDRRTVAHSHDLPLRGHLSSLW